MSDEKRELITDQAGREASGALHGVEPPLARHFPGDLDVRDEARHEQHRLLRVIRGLDGLLILGGPVVFWSVFGFDLSPALSLRQESGWHTALAAYAMLCCAAGL